MALFPLVLDWLLPSFLLLLLLLLPVFIVFNFRNRNPNQPPGPPKLPIIGNLHQLGKLPHRSLKKLSDNYGPIMLLKIGKVHIIVVSSPEIAKEALKVHDLQCCSRPFTHGAGRLSYNFLDVAFSPYIEYWTDIRKICVVQLFSNKRIKSFAHFREQTVASFINSTSETIPNPVNLSEQTFYVLDEIICKIACGRNHQGKQFDSGTKLEDAINEAMAILWSFSASDFIPCIGWIVDVLTGIYARREKTFREFDEFYQKVIDEHLDPHRSTSQDRNTVDTLLELTKDQNGDGCLSHVHVKGILMNIFLGGIDTSSVTIVWAMTELIKNPRVMKKLQAEIRSCVGRKPMAAESDCERLEYLKMVLKETLRLHTPVVLLIPNQTMAKCKIGGYEIHPNTRIQVNVFAIGRDPKAWRHPEDFYPERFADKAIDFRGQHFELIPFGAGRRICPGITMASATVELAIANLLYHFDWELPDGMKSEDISLEEEVGLTARKKILLCLVPIKYNWEE